MWKTFWKMVVKRAMQLAVTGIFIILGGICKFGYDAYLILKCVPAMEAKIDTLQGEVQKLNGKKISFRKDLEDYTKIDREVFVPMIGDLLIFNTEYTAVGEYTDANSRKWWRDHEGEMYQIFTDIETFKKYYVDKNDKSHWCYP